MLFPLFSSPEDIHTWASFVHFIRQTVAPIFVPLRLVQLPRGVGIERLQGVWPKIIPVGMEMPIFYVNFSSLYYPNLNDESLGPYG